MSHHHKCPTRHNIDEDCMCDDLFGQEAMPSPADLLLQAREKGWVSATAEEYPNT